jgi:hypothetical protein
MTLFGFIDSVIFVSLPEGHKMDHYAEKGKTIWLVYPTPAEEQHSTNQFQFGESPALAIETE